MTVFIAVVVTVVALAIVVYPFFRRRPGSSREAKPDQGRPGLDAADSEETVDLDAEIEAEVREMRRSRVRLCPQCGQKVRGSSRFCSSCGTDLRRGESVD